jgi:RNase H-fold protein (predicted Holliday junction resolvase)
MPTIIDASALLKQVTNVSSPRRALVGLDYGTAKIGLALTPDLQSKPQALMTVRTHAGSTARKMQRQKLRHCCVQA